MMSARMFRLLTTAAPFCSALAVLPVALHAAPPPAPAVYPQVVTQTPQGTIITPGSSVSRPADAGVRAHTNIHIFVPKGQAHINASGPSGKYENPASLACVYGVTAKVVGCDPETLKTVATGGSRTIAIVDAYDDPNAASDLAVYSAKYGLPAITSSNFQVVYASGTRPAQDSSGGWELEESLDVDMAHALAPNAKILLVEASSASTSALLAAEKVAAKMVSAAGGGEVSNSWGGSETANEETYETTFTAKGVVFFASAGDSPGTEFPSVLSNVVGVGGTTIQRSAAGSYKSEVSWADTGGGSSAYVPRPSYQSVVSGIVGSTKGAPDLALDANPNSGAWLYDTIPYEGETLKWVVVGGTSLASPATAALVNNAGSFNASSLAELTEIYAHYGVAADFHDITAGPCGNGGETTAKKGWDFCTGVGSSLGTAGK